VKVFQVRSLLVAGRSHVREERKMTHFAPFNRRGLLISCSTKPKVRSRTKGKKAGTTDWTLSRRFWREDSFEFLTETAVVEPRSLGRVGGSHLRSCGRMRERNQSAGAPADDGRRGVVCVYRTRYHPGPCGLDGPASWRRVGGWSVDRILRPTTAMSEIATIPSDFKALTNP
jgi:hypothetical protein